MKQKLWITLASYLDYCIDKELYQAIDYLREQVRVLVEHQKKQDKSIRLTNSQRISGTFNCRRKVRMIVADHAPGYPQKNYTIGTFHFNRILNPMQKNIREIHVIRGPISVKNAHS